MSADLFSQRYRARIGCGELFFGDLHLHDYRAVTEASASRGLTEDHDAEAIACAHVDNELKLRIQVARALENANERRKVKDLPRRARKRMADAYLQSAREGYATLAEEGFDYLFDLKGEAACTWPIDGRKWGVEANILVFDYVEVFFDLLPAEEQLEFSRDLNQRLQRGESRWYFQLGRWRREDWPRERDNQFDQILYALKRQSDVALERHEHEVSRGETVPSEPAFDRRAASEALTDAARKLWEADRLLESDLLSDKVRHAAAVRAARRALDHCAVYFPGLLYGPFVAPKAPRTPERRGGRPLLTAARANKDRHKPVPALVRNASSPQAAAFRLAELSRQIAYGSQTLSPKKRQRLLQRANLAEFLARLVLFDLGDPAKEDLEDADGDEVRVYSRLTAPPGAPFAFSHGKASLQLSLQDEATARLAVDLLARLCQFSTGSASIAGEAGGAVGKDPMATPHPKQMDAARWRVIRRVIFVGLGVAALGASFLAGLVLGNAGITL